MDTSKHIFQLHGVNTAEEPVLRKKLRRKEMFAFLEKVAPTVIAIEACGASHHCVGADGANRCAFCFAGIEHGTGDDGSNGRRCAGLELAPGAQRWGWWLAPAALGTGPF